MCDILRLHESILSGLVCNLDLSNDIANGQLHVLIQNHHLNILHATCRSLFAGAIMSLFFLAIPIFCTLLCMLASKGPPFTAH